MMVSDNTSDVHDLELLVKAKLTQFPTPLMVTEMQIIQSDYQFTINQQPELDDDEAKRRVFAAWLRNNAR